MAAHLDDYHWRAQRTRIENLPFLGHTLEYA
jgi:hypothetical protein